MVFSFKKNFEVHLDYSVLCSRLFASEKNTRRSIVDYPRDCSTTTPNCTPVTLGTMGGTCRLSSCRHNGAIGVQRPRRLAGGGLPLLLAGLTCMKHNKVSVVSPNERFHAPKSLQIRLGDSAVGFCVGRHYAHSGTLRIATPARTL